MAENYTSEIQFDGEKLRKEIKKRGLTGEGVSKMILGRSASFLSNKMSQNSIRPEDLKKICGFLGMKEKDFEFYDEGIQFPAGEDPERIHGKLYANGVLLREIKEEINAFRNDMAEWIDKFLYKPMFEISNSMSKQKEMLEEIANLLTTIKSQEVIQTNLLKELLNKQG